MKKVIHHTEFKVQAILFAAALLFGFSIKAQYNYLGTYNGQGTPDYLVNPGDVVSASFLNDVDASLPESKPVPTYNPQYISNGTETDILLKDSAAVWVTFVAEGAGYRNVLGFYTYDMANPPQTVGDINNETIIFPNVSEQWSGGELLPGDKVKLGDFSAGTGIGWFLIANGWNGNSVGSGYWKVYSNPDFNPESLASERNHIILLNDSNNQRVVLGFEDIRRDYGSCDQDFNDAIFYVSANPYSAIVTDSINTIVDAGSGVSSGGNGGLESNGDLASKIAVRNFLRQKSKPVNYDAFELLPRVHENAIQTGKINSSKRNKSVDQNLEELLPTSSLFSTQAYETTPSDLLQITNAQEVFAVDYVGNNKRKGAAMVMYTENKVYEHTKAVCDRLKGAELLELTTIQINQHPFIMFKLKQESGEIEYAINFVIQEKTDGVFQVENHWALSKYPNASTNLNFQVWSSTTAMTVQLVQDALLKIAQRGSLQYANHTTELPQVYVKKGTYKMGKLNLTIANPSGIQSVELKGNLTRTETSNRENVLHRISLNGNSTQEVEIDLGKLFDVGFQLNTVSGIADVLYTADGAWGTDYEIEGANLVQYEVAEDKHSEILNCIALERGIIANGSVKNYLSFFRTMSAGGKSIDATHFNAIQLKLASSHEVEVTVLKKSIDSWTNQFRTILPASQGEETRTIFLNDLSNTHGDIFDASDIQSVAISIKGDGKNTESFTININQLAFVTAKKSPKVESHSFSFIPNPVQYQGEVKFYSPTESTSTLFVRDAKGNIVKKMDVVISKGLNTVPIQLEELSKGIYFCQMINNSNTLNCKFIKL